MFVPQQLVKWVGVILLVIWQLPQILIGFLFMLVIKDSDVVETKMFQRHTIIYAKNLRCTTCFGIVSVIDASKIDDRIIFDKMEKYHHVSEWLGPVYCIPVIIYTLFSCIHR